MSSRALQLSEGSYKSRSAPVNGQDPALVVADRFHVIRLVNQQFVKTWAELDEVGRKNRGLLSLMRRHPDRMTEDQRVRLNRYLGEIPGLRHLYIVWQDLN